jgi:hypothetical protein
LVVAEQRDAPMRYRLLETVRQYASEQLEAAGETAVTRERHSAWCLALAEAADAELDGPREVAWLARLEREHDNLRAALAWCRTEERGAEIGLRLAGALQGYWSIRGHYAEGRGWLEGALATGAGAAAALRARAFSGAGTMAWLQHDFAAAEVFHAHSLILSRETHDAHGVAFALHNLGVQAAGLGDDERALGLYEESLARYQEREDTRGAARVLNSLGNLASRARDYHRALTLQEESLALYRAAADKQGIAVVLGNLGELARVRGDGDRATALLHESLALNRAGGYMRATARDLTYLGDLASDRGDDAAAYAFHAEGLALARELADQAAIAASLAGLARIADARGCPERAARLFGAAAVLRSTTSSVLDPADSDALERHVAAVRAELSVEAFAAAWAAGEALSLDEAIVEALSDQA